METQIGMIQSFAGSIDDPSWHELNGAMLDKCDYPDYYEWVSGSPDELIRGLIVNDHHVKVPDASDGRFLRNAGGNAGEVGTKQGDAIRNITGTIAYGYCDWTGGALTSSIENKWADVPMFSLNDEQYSRKRINLDVSRVVPTANENRPLSMTVKYYIKIVDDRIKSQEIISAPKLQLSYKAGSMILLEGEIYKCTVDTVWTGTLNDDWTPYSNDTTEQIGSIKISMGSIDDSKWHVLDGTVLDRYAYLEYYDWVVSSTDPIINDLIVDDHHVRVPLNNADSTSIKYHIKLKD